MLAFDFALFVGRFGRRRIGKLDYFYFGKTRATLDILVDGVREIFLFPPAESQKILTSLPILIYN